MNKIHRKIISGGILIVCAAAAMGALSHLSRKAENSAVPASAPYSEEPPVIIIDAGHGGFDGGCVSAEGVPEKGINLSILLRLRDLLELNGYEVQVTRDDNGEILKNDQGGRLRPDVIFNLPDKKRLVIDSKVSLTAYTDYVNAGDEKLRQAALKRHLASVRKHVDELDGKSYQRWVKNSADFVMMFIPNEPAYLLAMSADSDLWAYAFQRQVVIVSPTHLFSVVRLIDQLWSRDRQTKNALDIAEEAGKMIDKFSDFVKDLKNIDKALQSAQKAYDDASKKLSEGRGNLMGRIQKISDMGAKATKQLPSIDD